VTTATDTQSCGALDIVFADDDLIIVNKPSGLLSVPGRGPDKQDCLSTRLQQRFADALVVHRLDMATSGLMVFARGAASQRALGRAFAQREIHKRYVAVVQGAVDVPTGNWHTLDLPLRVDWPNRPMRVIDPVAGQPSTTRWRLMHADKVGQTSLVELEPVTGRTHQLRVHMLALGYPIVGDALYAPAAVITLAPRLLLHAATLELSHPRLRQDLRFYSPAPF
jgi:tRNA pseudouridine32 synthase/23S rRNA pseudouridine746 synthase